MLLALSTKGSTGTEVMDAACQAVSIACLSQECQALMTQAKFIPDCFSQVNSTQSNSYSNANTQYKEQAGVSIPAL
jgi:hypothetical protein